jgi:hypothetical protein
VRGCRLQTLRDHACARAAVRGARLRRAQARRRRREEAAALRALPRDCVLLRRADQRADWARHNPDCRRATQQTDAAP